VKKGREESRLRDGGRSEHSAHRLVEKKDIRKRGCKKKQKENSTRRKNPWNGKNSPKRKKVGENPGRHTPIWKFEKRKKFGLPKDPQK